MGTNYFSGLGETVMEDQLSDEIQNDNQLRNRKKKLRLLEKKAASPENERKRNRIMSEIDEYESRQQCHLKKKPTKPTKQTDDDEFLDQCFRESQTPAYQEEKKKAQEKIRRQEEEKIRREKVRREQRREQQQRREQEQDQDQRQRREHDQDQDQRQRREHDQDQDQRQRREQQQRREQEQLEYMEYMRNANAPNDILNLNESFTDSLYKKLAMKYHPDKGGTTEQFKILGRVKDHHRPNVHVHDETWMK